MTNLDSILKSRDIIADKGLSSQSYDFSSSHVWMWELDYKYSWAPKIWCFSTVMLENTFESPLDSKNIKPVNPKGNQFWIFFERNDAEAETPILRPPDIKNCLNGKDSDVGKGWRQKEKGMTEDEMVEWHHWLNGQEFELAMDREAWHAAVHGLAKSWTRMSNWTELSLQFLYYICIQCCIHRIMLYCITLYIWRRKESDTTERLNWTEPCLKLRAL